MTVVYSSSRQNRNNKKINVVISDCYFADDGRNLSKVCATRATHLFSWFSLQFLINFMPLSLPVDIVATKASYFILLPNSLL